MTKEDKVLNFMKTMGQNTFNSPSETPLEVRQLAVILTFEELHELAQALDVEKTFSEQCEKSFEDIGERHHPAVVMDGDNVDDVEVADAFGDIDYTNSWGINSTGLKPTYGLIFNEICRSNDSKACATRDEAEKTVAHYENLGIVCKIFEINGKYIVKDAKTGKVKKSILYSEADLKPYVPTK